MNPVVHFEMPYHDGPRAASFYAAAFGWHTQMLGEAMGHYIVVTTATQDAKPGAPAGAINGGLFPYKADWPARQLSLLEQKLVELARALALAPASPRIHMLAGDLQLVLGQPARAIPAYRFALGHWPRDPRLLNQLAHALALARG